MKLEEEELERRKLDRKIVNEEHWMRYGVTARRKRNMRRVGQLADLRSERREALRSVGVAAMMAQDAEETGALVIDAERISKSYGDRLIVRDFFDAGHASRQNGRRWGQRRRKDHAHQHFERVPLRRTQAWCAWARMSRWPLSISSARRSSRRRPLWTR